MTRDIADYADEPFCKMNMADGSYYMLSETEGLTIERSWKQPIPPRVLEFESIAGHRCSVRTSLVEGFVFSTPETRARSRKFDADMKAVEGFSDDT